jgi:hypothetical protein
MLQFKCVFFLISCISFFPPSSNSPVSFQSCVCRSVYHTLQLLRTPRFRHPVSHAFHLLFTVNTDYFPIFLNRKVFIGGGQSQPVQCILPDGRNLFSSLRDNIVVFSEVYQTAKQCKKGQKYGIGTGVLISP